MNRSTTFLKQINSIKYASVNRFDVLMNILKNALAAPLKISLFNANGKDIALTVIRETFQDLQVNFSLKFHYSGFLDDSKEIISKLPRTK